MNNKSIKNILVVRNDRFGEFLLNIPALRALKETFTQAKLIAVVDPYVRDLAEALPFIDEIIEWGRAGHSLSAKLKLVGLLKRKGIDIAVILNPAKDFNIITYLCGIPIRVGYDRKWGFLLTHKMKDKKHLGQKHEIEYNLELVSLVGAKTEDRALFISVEDNIIDSLFSDNGIEDSANLVALHPWTSDPIKQWPLEYFYSLAQRLTKELNLKVLIVGGKDEAAQDRYFCKNPEHSFINLSGRTTLRELAVLLKKCRLLISGDSGPVHLACAVNTRVLSIFRSDLPGKSAKRWGPWGEGHAVIEKDDLAKISVDEVLNKTKEVLGR